MGQVFTAAVIGIDGILVAIEVDTAASIPSCTIVGLPDTAVKEARDRIRAAIKNSGYPFPRMKVTVNLAPADVRKEGSMYDLPIAIAILAASDTFHGRINQELLSSSLFAGELALSGAVRPVHGIAAIAACARAMEKPTLFCPEVNVREAQLVPDCVVVPVPTLRACMEYLSNEAVLAPSPAPMLPPSASEHPSIVDCAAIVGNEHAKRALIVAAAGNHNLRMVGPPGSGKTMLARALPGLLPSLTREEMLDVTRIWSISGCMPPDQPFIGHRPFRDPHHSSSLVALVGGGANPRPGEVSLAHHGVLFLDEFPEFPRSVLESLRQPLESGRVTIARASDHVTFPAHFLLVTAENPCPCGYLGDPSRSCICAPRFLTRYRSRLSGPLLDRIDLHIDVPRLPIEKLEGEGGISSAILRAVVEEARARQHRRFAGLPWTTNAAMPSDYLRHTIVLTDAARDVLRNAVQQYHLSGRVYFRVLKVAQTIADIAASDAIDTLHIAEALQYRLRETATTF